MRLLSIPLALAILSPAALAQCFDQAYGPAIGGALLTGEVILPIQSIGFPFPLAGTTYTDLHVSTKGEIYLSNAGVPAPPGFTDFTATGAEFASGGPRIAALWCDYLMYSGTAEVYLNATPTKCTVTWENIVCYANCAPFTMQVQLLPTGEVLFFWGPGAINNSSAGFPTWQVGVVGVSPGAATLNSSLDLSAGGVAADNLIYEEFPGATFDMAGNGLHLIPLNPGWVYTTPAATQCASAVTYGKGCIQEDDSIYEFWGSSASFDANLLTISFLRGPSGYTVLTAIPGTFVPPGGGAVQVAPAVLDGAQVFPLSAGMPVPGGTTSSINITTKGQIELGAANLTGLDYTPTIAEHLAHATTVVACWHDFDQVTTGSGQILFEEVGGIAYVTWNGVYSFSNPTPNTMQFQLNVATGDITLVLGTMGGMVGNFDSALVGYSVGGPSALAGAIDWSTLLSAINVADVAVGPGLAISTTQLPTIGNAGFTVDVSNVPPILPIALVYFGTTVNPGFDLGFFGMPGCELYQLLDFYNAAIPVGPTWSGSLNLPVPNNPAIAGTEWTGQALAFTLANPANLVSSNGLTLTAGF